MTLRDALQETLQQKVQTCHCLDNEYYIEIIRPRVQVDINSPFTGTTKVQWQDPNTKPNFIFGRLNPNQLPIASFASLIILLLLMKVTMLTQLLDPIADNLLLHLVWWRIMLTIMLYG